MHKDDWKSDGHIWSNEGTKTVKINDYEVKKRYFNILKGYDGKKRIVDKTFSKHVWSFGDTSLIQYKGDSKVSIPRSHGNAKSKNKLFVPTQPSVIQFLKERTKTRENPHEIYKKNISGEYRQGYY